MLFLIPLAFVVIFSGTGAVHATTVTPDTGAEEGQVDSVTSDNNDATTLGLSLSTNSDETSLSGTLQILLIITVISLSSINSGYGDLIYTNHYRVTFCADGNRYAEFTT